MAEIYEKLRPYHFHGVELNNDPVQATGDCPFCHRANKLGVETNTGKYRCVHCESSGNIYGFLAQLHQSGAETTDDQAFDNLAHRRGLTPDGLRDFLLVISPITGEWLAPTFNSEGKINNLFRVVESTINGKPKFRPMSTPGCKLAPFGVNLLLEHKAPTTIRVMEGLWDTIAMYSSLRSYRQQGDKLIKTGDPDNSLYSEYGVMGTPGANNWDEAWFGYAVPQKAGGYHPALDKPAAIELWYDNDHPRKYPSDHEKAGQLMLVKGKHLRPGWDGMQRVLEMAGSTARKRPASVAILNWANFYGQFDGKAVDAHATPGHHPDLPDTFDFRDACKAFTPSVALLGLAGLLEFQEISPPKKSGPATPGQGTQGPLIEPLHCESYEELCGHFSRCLHFTQHLRDTLAVMLAIVVSTDLSTDVDHIWLRVIGPPGSGKSTLAEAVSAAREWVAPKSTLTGFHSGFVDYDKVTGERIEDASLLHELNGKTIIMKDADTLANSPSRDRILSELRDLYDGSSRSHYRNKVKSDFENIKLTFILCGTDALRLLNKTFLGERFLDCEIIRNEDTTPYLQRASASAYASLSGGFAADSITGSTSANGVGDSETSADDAEGDGVVATPNKILLKQATYGFIKHLKDTLGNRKAPIIEPATLTQLESLARYVALLRARKPDVADLTFRPRTELPTRLTNQLVKMAFSLALVLGRDSADEEVVRIVSKVVHDTSLGFPQEICGALAEADRETHRGLSVRSLALELNVPQTNIARLLFNMMEFGLVQRMATSNNSGQRGRDSHLWELTPTMLGLYNSAHPVEKPDEPPTSKSKKPSRSGVKVQAGVRPSKSAGTSGRKQNRPSPRKATRRSPAKRDRGQNPPR